MKQVFFRTAGILAACCIMLLMCAGSAAAIRPVLQSKKTAAVFSEKPLQEYGSFSPRIIDGRTDRPIENALIVIPETDERYRTDRNGQTGPIRVPVISDMRFSSVHEKPWGEITLLVYAEGYAPYALFYLQITEAFLREGPVIMLFPGEHRPFSIVEGPADSWAAELLEKYAP